MAIVSIIVPVYNAEKYVARALNSLITQSLEDIEILCIDDGSIDKSFSILKNYEKQDSRIKVFFQENAGPGPAKNVGLAHATGTYVMFCDADDYFEPTMCEEMVVCIENENVDFAVCDIFILEQEKDHGRKELGINELYLRDFGKFDLTKKEQPIILGVIWNKIFRMDIIKKYDICFLNCLQFTNDLTFFYKYLSISNSVFQMNKKLYNYLLHSNSVVGKLLKTKSRNRAYELMQTFYDVLQFVHKHGVLQKNCWMYDELELRLLTNFAACADKKKLENILNDIKPYVLESYYNYMPKFSSLIKRVVQPAFKDNKNCYVFATDDKFAPYLGVAMSSLIENSNKNSVYDICVLYTKLSHHNINLLETLSRNNISIRFIDINAYCDDTVKNTFYIHAHFSIETYFRFFIPEIFKEYEKVLYLDCDMIFMKDMAKIFEIEMENTSIGVVLEYRTKTRWILDSSFEKYLEETLKMQYPENYFNAGLLLLNIPELLKNNFTDTCFAKLQEVQKPTNVDQCILNSCYSHSLFKLPACWNVQLHVDKKILKKYTTFAEYMEYCEALEDPIVLHYCGSTKPWTSLDMPFATVWWEYARNCVFYESLLLIRK